MTEDPIVQEVRLAREEYAAQFNYDLRALCEDLRHRTEDAARAGRQVVPLPAARLASLPPETKKAG